MLLNCFSFHYTSNTPSHKTIFVQCILWSANIYTVFVKNNWIYFGGTILLTIKYISVFFKNNIHYIHTLVMVVDPLLFCVCKFYFIKCVAHTNSSMQSCHVCLHVIVLFQVPLIWFLCPRHSKNGGGALSVTPVRACVRAFVRPSVVRPLSKFGVHSITFERLHRFNSNLVCWYIIS